MGTIDWINERAREDFYDIPEQAHVRPHLVARSECVVAGSVSEVYEPVNHGVGDVRRI